MIAYDLKKMAYTFGIIMLLTAFLSPPIDYSLPYSTQSGIFRFILAWVGGVLICYGCSDFIKK